MNQLSSETPKKKLIGKTIAGLLETPQVFTSGRALADLRRYNPGQSTLADMALWNVYKAVEAEKGFFEAIAILEDTLTGRIKEPAEIEAALAARTTKETERKRREIYRKEIKALKRVAEEEGVILMHDLMIRCHTRDLEKTTKQMKEAGIRLVDLRVLVRALMDKKKTSLVGELQMLLGAKDIRKMRLVAMSPEYHQRVLEEIKI